MKTTTHRTTRSGRRTRYGLAVAAAAVAALGVPMLSGATTAPTSLKVVANPVWGPTLALKNGYTVYRLSTDGKNKSNCSGACAVAWPPVLLAKGQTKPVGVGVSGLGSIARAGGQRQVTIAGHPLYRFIGDKTPLSDTGNVKDKWGTWYSINPAKPGVAPKQKTSTGGGSTTTTGVGGIAY
jgi:predicted lipoprotein with Yx(FWY)xxD motif